MNTKALTTTLAVLASTPSLAMAHPTREPAPVSVSAHVAWNLGDPGRAYPPIPAPVVRDHRSYYDSDDAPPVVVRPYAGRRGDGWGYERELRGKVLADGLSYNTGEYRKDIVLEGRGRFNTLVLNEEGGRDFIKEVRIEFIGGAVQSIPVNRVLHADESMTFDLDGHDRAINRIFVYRADGNNMNVGFPSRGEFSVIGL